MFDYLNLDFNMHFYKISKKFDEKYQNYDISNIFFKSGSYNKVYLNCDHGYFYVWNHYVWLAQ
jgi:hypothetical protein